MQRGEFSSATFEVLAKCLSINSVVRTGKVSCLAGGGAHGGVVGKEVPTPAQMQAAATAGLLHSEGRVFCCAL